MAGAFHAGTVTARLTLDLNDWSANIEKAKADTTSLAGVINSKKDDIEKLGKTFTAVGAAISVALGAAIKKTADYGDELIKTSQKTGIATEVLSGFKLAADKSDLSLSTLAAGLAKMTRNVGDAIDGNEAMQLTLEKMGLKATDATGKMRPMDDLIGDIADKFAAMPDGVEKSQLAMDLFGKSGVAMIPLLNAGRAGLDAEREAAERLGMVISEKTARQGELFNDTMTVLNRSFQGIVMVIGQALIPIVTKLAEVFTAINVGIRRVAEIFPPLTTAITVVVGAFGALMFAAGPVLLMLPKLITGWQTVSALLPIIGTRLVALNAKMMLSIPIYAAVVAAVLAVNAAINAYSASQDRQIEAIQKNAEQQKKTWDWVKATYASGVKTTIQELDRLRAGWQKMGKTQEEIGDALHARFSKLINVTKTVAAAAVQLSDAVISANAAAMDSIKKATLSEYQYTVWAINAKYDANKKMLEKEKADAASFALNERARQAELTNVHKTEADRRADIWRKYNAAVAALDKKTHDVQIKNGQDIGKKIAAYVEFMGQNWKWVMSSITGASFTAADKIKTKFQQAMDKTNDAVAKFSEKFGGFLTAGLQAFSMFSSAMIEKTNQRYQKEFAKMDAEYAKQKDLIAKSLMSETEKNAAYEALDAEYADKKKALEIKQAEANKKSGISQAIVNTALAIVSALSTKPFLPMGLIAAAMAAAAGAIQIAAIKSAPLPAMAEGGLINRPTTVLAGEAGPEAILPMRELHRILGTGPGMKKPAPTMNFSIKSFDAVDVLRVTRKTIIPEIRKAMDRESLLVPAHALGR